MISKKSHPENLIIEVVDGVFTASHEGYLTEAIAQKIMVEMYEYSKSQRLKKAPSLALFDISKVTGQSSDARRRIKTVRPEAFDRLAVVGGNMAMRVAAKHIVKLSGIDIVTNFSRNRRSALKWLHQEGPTELSKHRKMSVLMASRFVVPAILVLILGATTASWYQAQQQLTKDSNKFASSELQSVEQNLDERLSTYVNQLDGFKAYFEASDNVSRADFYDYFKSLAIQKNNPGFSIFLYIPVVPAEKLDAFIAAARADTTYPEKSLPNYTVKKVSGNKIYYPVLYSAQGSSTRNIEGADLSQNPSRVALLEKAKMTNDLVVSETIELNGTEVAKLGSRPGFYFTIPVHSSANTTEPEDVIGYVSATFEHKLILKGLMSDKNKSVVRIYDDAQNVKIFEEGPTPILVAEHNVQSTKYELGGQTWRIELSTAPNYGVGDADRNLPRIIAYAGTFIAMLLVLLYYAVSRSRHQAIKLAEEMTRDLNRERNEAVAVREKDDAILGSIGDAVFALDTNGIVTLFNKVAQKLSGFSQEEALGKHYTEILQFIDETTGKSNDGFIAKALRGTTTSMKNHTALIRKDGGRTPVADSAAPIRNVVDEIIGVIVVFRDVTKEHQLDRAKAEFVSLASHQLRTPLSAINWYGELLLSGDAGKLGKDQHGYVQEIYEGSQRMAELVNSLLDVSRLEVGKLINLPAPTNVQDIIKSLSKELSSQIEPKHLTVNYSIGEIDSVFADPKQLRMIIQNLMSNAVKYTDVKGKVDVTLRIATAEDIRKANLTNGTIHPGDYWCFSVKDDGYGIPLDQHVKIFTKLYRADNVRKLDVEGTGLGLFIVKEVVDKMGGNVWFDSVEDKGSTFTVVVPLHVVYGKQ